MKDTAACVVIGAGGAVPIELVPPAMRVDPVHTRKPVRRKHKKS